MANNGAAFVHHNTNATKTIGGVNQGTVLLGISINSKGASANICTVTDVATSTVIAVIDTTANVTYLDFFQLRCRDGFTVTMATGTAADLTIFYG